MIKVDLKLENCNSSIMHKIKSNYNHIINDMFINFNVYVSTNDRHKMKP